MRADLERLTLAPELARILREAEDIARQIPAPPHSLHVLLALFTSDDPARHTLLDLGVDEDKILELCDPRAEEPRQAMRRVLTRAASVAAGCGADQVRALHVLVAFTREPDTVARSVLEATGLSLFRIRSRALADGVPRGPRWTRTVSSMEHSAVSHRGSIGPDGVSSRLPTAIGRSPSARKRMPAEPPDRPRRTQAPIPSVRNEREPELPPEPSSPGAPSQPADGPWTLDATVFPWLTSLGRNLSAAAARGELDPLIGRERELEQLMDVLGKRRANNPCLIGEPGVGKTAVVEGLAMRALAAPSRSRARRWVVVALDVGRLLMGTHLRGSFSERLQGLIEEVRKSDGRIILFVDEIHSLIGAGGSEGSPDASQELKAVWARGELPCIGATTYDEFHRTIAHDPALVRRFVPVRVDEPSIDEAIELVQRVAPQYAAHHGVTFDRSAIEASVRLSARFLPEQRLPDKAIAMVDLAGSRASREGRATVGDPVVKTVLAERLGLSADRLEGSESERLLELEARLSTRVVGHRRQLERISDSLRRNAAGFRGGRPRGVFLLLGPTGVGKTEVAKILAEELFGSNDDLIRFDLNEFQEAHSTARLIGAPPGYVGHETGGQLTDAVRRRPARVVLFDEVEKAHPDVLNVLLRLLDEGQLTDARGITVSFTETILMLTSNAGSGGGGRPLGFASERPAAAEAAWLERARRAFSPELWARIPEKLVFHPLTRDEAMEVARRMVESSSHRLQSERGIRFRLDGPALRHVLDRGGWDPEQGARPLRAALARLVESTIARRILEGRLHADEEVWVTVRDGALCFQVGDLGESLSSRPAAR